MLTGALFTLLAVVRQSAAQDTIAAADYAGILNHGGPPAQFLEMASGCAVADTSDACAANNFACVWSDSTCGPSAIVEEATDCAQRGPSECQQDSLCEGECTTDENTGTPMCVCKVAGPALFAAACEAADSCGESDWFTHFPLDPFCEAATTETGGVLPPEEAYCRTNAQFDVINSCATLDPTACTATASVRGTDREVCVVDDGEGSDGDLPVCVAAESCADESTGDAGVSQGCFDAVSPHARDFAECGSCSPEITSSATVCAACEAAIGDALALCVPTVSRCWVDGGAVLEIIVPYVCAGGGETECASIPYPFGGSIPVPSVCEWSGDACIVSDSMALWMVCTASDEAACRTNDVCQWSVDDNRCSLSRAAGMSMLCASGTDEAVCRGLTIGEGTDATAEVCEWGVAADSTGEECMLSSWFAAAMECEDAADEAACRTNDVCQWRVEENEEDHCSLGSTAGMGMLCASGTDEMECSGLTIGDGADAMAGVCEWGTVDDSTEEECMLSSWIAAAMECEDIDEAVCRANEACQWSVEGAKCEADPVLFLHMMCTGPTNAISCEDVAIGACVWSGTACELNPIVVLQIAGSQECGEVSEAAECNALQRCAWRPGDSDDDGQEEADRCDINSVHFVSQACGAAAAGGETTCLSETAHYGLWGFTSMYGMDEVCAWNAAECPDDCCISRVYQNMLNIEVQETECHALLPIDGDSSPCETSENCDVTDDVSGGPPRCVPAEESEAGQHRWRVLISLLLNAGLSGAMERYAVSADYNAEHAEAIDRTLHVEMRCLLSHTNPDTCSPQTTNQECEWEDDPSGGGSCTSHGTPLGGVSESDLEIWCEEYDCDQIGEEANEPEPVAGGGRCNFGQFMGLLARAVDGSIGFDDFAGDEIVRQCRGVAHEMEAHRGTCHGGGR